jgi:DGQHR domain-containing protein
MANEPDLKRLKSSWTKYDSVRMIRIIGNDELNSYMNEEEPIDEPILRAYLGIEKLTDSIPEYWKELIIDYPKERRLFAMLAGIFTHFENIDAFANIYATNNMVGVFKISNGGKHQTNLRSALVESGAALTSYRRKQEVPYDFTKIFQQENIGKLFKKLLMSRLFQIGYKAEEVENSFYDITYKLNFNKSLSLSKKQFKDWLEGRAISQILEFRYDLNDLKKQYKATQTFKIKQWLTKWDEVDYDLPMRKKPEDHFYMFKMDIRLLKRISDVHRRKTTKARSEENNVQRTLKEDRTIEIKNYVNQGFPLSTASDKDRLDESNSVLKMPGFLPTAILVNIIGPGQRRGNSEIQSKDLIKIEESSEGTNIIIPEEAFVSSWNPELKPIEVIDGQHRLWAFDETETFDGDFEVPVIAYYNLDRAWQAYMFYVINIKPKKINTSLGYDLYPLLRTQEWLENTKDGLKVYRETRAQELVEAIWLYPESPWHRRISMLGEDSSNISQNAFVRALTDSYFKKTKRSPSGLFSDVVRSKNEELKWVRPQQAAFLILLWDSIAKALSPEIVEVGKFEWIDKIRSETFQLSSLEKELQLDKTFISKTSNLSRDQGVTGISLFSNDFFYVLANESEIDFNDIEWDSDIDERQIENSSIDLAISKFINHPIFSYIQLFASEISKFDWRTSMAEFDDPIQMELQKKYRGSGGYREIWKDLLKVFLESKNSKIREYAQILNQSK